MVVRCLMPVWLLPAGRSFPNQPQSSRVGVRRCIRGRQLVDATAGRHCISTKDSLGRVGKTVTYLTCTVNDRNHCSKRTVRCGFTETGQHGWAHGILRRWGPRFLSFSVSIYHVPVFQLGLMPCHCVFVVQARTQRLEFGGSNPMPARGRG